MIGQLNDMCQCVALSRRGGAYRGREREREREGERERADSTETTAGKVRK